MWILLLGLTTGLLASSLAGSSNVVKLRGCSFKGVFHIQGNDRYSLTFDEAKDLCKALGATLASFDQVTVAHNKSMESCRYGWISDGNVSISRHTSNNLCAAGLVGVFTLIPSQEQNDAYCYDDKDLSDKNCSAAISPDSLSQANGSLPSEPADNETHTDVLAHSINTDEPYEFYTTSPTFTTEEEENDDVEENETNLTSSIYISTAAEDLDDPNTVTPTLGDEGNMTTDGLKRTVDPEIMDDGKDENTKVMPNQESTGSVLGDSTQITEKPNTDDLPSGPKHRAMDTETSNENETELGMDSGSTSSADDTPSSGSRDWLVILLVVIAVIVIIVIAVLLSRNRLCGKSQTLMITPKSSEGNGTAAAATSAQAQEREQEMVTLMNKEKVQENGNTEEFTVITLEESPEKNEQV